MHIVPLTPIESHGNETVTQYQPNSHQEPGWQSGYYQGDFGAYNLRTQSRCLDPNTGQFPYQVDVITGQPNVPHTRLCFSTGPSGNQYDNHYSYLCTIELCAQRHSTQYCTHSHMGRHLRGQAPYGTLYSNYYATTCNPHYQSLLVRYIPTRIWAAQEGYNYVENLGQQHNDNSLTPCMSLLILSDPLMGNIVLRYRKTTTLSFR